MENRKLLVNKIQCPDGTTLESRFTHDFVEHTQEDGREYFVDGGLSYSRIGCSDEKYIDLCVYEDDEHEIIRENFTWGRSYDADMNPLPQTEYILLKDITEAHLDALIDFTSTGYPDRINKLFIAEKQFREQL